MCLCARRKTGSVQDPEPDGFCYSLYIEVLQNEQEVSHVRMVDVFEKHVY